MKLGKLPAHPAWNRVRLRAHLSAPLPPPPEECDWSTKVSVLSPMLNDQIGDCGLAGPGHRIQCATAENGHEVIPSDTAIERAYCDVGGFVPGDDSTDNGVVMYDVMQYWRKPPGIAGWTIKAWGAVDLKDRLALKEAVYYFGPVLIGLSLPASSEEQDAAAEWFLALGGTQGDPAPGSRGGHCVVVVGYGPRGFLVITWGRRFWVSWDFIDAYCDEAFCVVGDDWGDADGAPSGLLLAELVASLDRVTA